jgi:homoserine dehydrogenase
VNRTLAQLLRKKTPELRERGVEWRITGVASRRLGWISDLNGVDPERLPAGVSAASSDVRAWLRAARADVLFEATSLDPQAGQPAIDHIRAALEIGAHAITANKGPIVYAYEDLRDLAEKQGRRFLFESTVMDGVPIFSMFRSGLPAVQLKGFHGILNSTTNVILSGMEEGLSFDESLERAQELGVAETDASHDIDGWDAAVKTAALVRVLMGERILLEQIERIGIRGLSAEQVRAARAAGTPYKLVCRAHITECGLTARVHPERVPSSDPMASVSGTSSIIAFETDIFPELVITENSPGLEATAYGMLADFVRAVAAAEL